MDKDNKKKNVTEKPQYLVGIGASAGGLEAIFSFFDGMQATGKTKLSFVLVQHLLEGSRTLMDKLLLNHTYLDIIIVQNAMRLEARKIYLTPPHSHIWIENDCFYLETKLL